ncbi:MAG: HPP family protein [Synergistales bacterium]|jgi:CBS domain-containing protein
MNSQAREIMHKDLTAVTEKDRVEDALHALYNQRLTGLPVVKEDWVLVGFLSETDILQAAFPTYLEFLAQSSFLDSTEGGLVERLSTVANRTVGELMNPHPCFVEPTASLVTVADMMIRKRIKRLPVVENGRLVGIIDRGAFFEHMMEKRTHGGSC